MCACGHTVTGTQACIAAEGAGSVGVVVILKLKIGWVKFMDSNVTVFSTTAVTAVYGVCVHV